MAIPTCSGRYTIAKLHVVLTQLDKILTSGTRIGMGTYIPRWKKGSNPIYKVDRNSFPTYKHYFDTVNAFNTAASIYNSLDLGVILRYVDSGPSTFTLTYAKNDGNTNMFLESAFFPDAQAEERMLKLYAKAYSLPTKSLLPISLHALGDIFDSHHEFAHEDEYEKKWLSKLLGDSDTESTMNYFDDWTLAIMTPQDVSGLQNFYALAGEEYEGMPLLDFSPRFDWTFHIYLGERSDLNTQSSSPKAAPESHSHSPTPPCPSRSSLHHRP